MRKTFGGSPTLAIVVYDLLPRPHGNSLSHPLSPLRVPLLLLPSSTSSPKTRSILTEEEAVAIFKIKITNDSTSRSERLSAAAVARDYRVSEKTIRDIWTARTWIREIVHLDPVRAALVERLKPPKGR